MSETVSSPQTTVEDSRWWLHDLAYGAEKVVRIKEESADVRALARRKGPGSELGLAERHLDQTRSKLARTEGQVRDLIDSVARIAYETDGELGFVEGVIKGIDFKKRTLSLQTEAGRENIEYARVEEHGEPRSLSTVIPIIELETTVPYEF